jgi:hypothetical protein
MISKETKNCKNISISDTESIDMLENNIKTSEGIHDVHDIQNSIYKWHKIVTLTYMLNSFVHNKVPINFSMSYI